MKRIVWDWNGTLFDDLELCFECINVLLDKYQVPVLQTIDEYKEVFRFPIQDYYKKAGFDFSKTPYSQLAAEYMDYYQVRSMRCPLQKDAVKALKTVKKRGMKQIVLSASQIDYLLDQIHLFDIETQLDSIWGIRNIYARSKAELAREMKEQYKEDALWFVGDSVHDYEVASQVHCPCVLVTTGHESEQRLRKTGVPVFGSLLESVDYIWSR